MTMDKTTSRAAGITPFAEPRSGVVIQFPVRPALVEKPARINHEDFLEAHRIIDEGMADMWKPRLNDNQPPTR